jgi:thioredoxin reductase
MYDVIIVGGGPAGLSAALVLGRCRRSVVVCDAGSPRNAAASHLHNYLSRDGIEPPELLRLGREEVARYAVEFRHAEAVDGRCLGAEGFEVVLDDGSRLRSRKVLLATGVRDAVPDIPGFKELYGRSVHHCPYCDGYEHRDQHIIAYGPGRAAAGLALALRTWSRHVTACTDGRRGLRPDDLARLEAAQIAVRPERVRRLVDEDGAATRLEFERGPDAPCQAVFFNTAQFQRSNLAVRMGCSLDKTGAVQTGRRQRTGVSGLFLAGDAAKEVQFAIVAAAEGATAAVAINRELQDESYTPASGAAAERSA